MTGEVSLISLSGGAAVEKFDDELRRAVENILDPNTSPTAARTINLKVTLKPTAQRDRVIVGINVASKLTPHDGTATQMYVGKDPKTQQVLAFEDDPKQVTVQSFIEQQKKNVTELPQKAEVSK